MKINSRCQRCGFGKQTNCSNEKCPQCGAFLRAVPIWINGKFFI